MQGILRVASPAILLATAIVALLLALEFGGGADAPLLIDPGAVVRWGLPLAKLIHNLALALTLGALLLAVLAVGREWKAYGLLLDVAAAAASLWTVATAVGALLTFSSSYNRPPSLDPVYGDAFAQFLTRVGLGQAWLITFLAAAAVTVLCFAVRNQTALLGVAVVTAAAAYPLAGQGHAGSAATHDIVVTAMWFHIVFAALWLGGLLALPVVRRHLDAERFVAVLRRYSTLALISFIVVAVSGYVSAAIRTGELAALTTPYGILVVAKVLSLLALGAFGALQRRALIRRLAASGLDRFFWLMVAIELGFMGVASGVAAALARTATPVVEAPIAETLPDGTVVELAGPTPAEILTSSPLPPELTSFRYVTEWKVDLLWMFVAVFGIAFYLMGVRRLRRRGDTWPWYRSVLWVAGMLVLLWVTNGAINVYQDYLFSVHMLGHMLLSMMIPVLLVLAAPITLALRTVEKRADGTRGGREWIMLAIHSRYATVITHPLVASALFAGSLWAFYYTPLFRWAVTEHLGHTWMVAHFLLTGYLFVNALVGVDPSPHRTPYPLRLVILLATMAMHAFFGLAIMSSEGLLLADWFGGMGREWGPAPIDDQVRGGGIAWSIGEIPTVTLAILVAIMWARSDEREAKRRDRSADRDGDAELEAYNAMLASRGTASGIGARGRPGPGAAD